MLPGLADLLVPVPVLPVTELPVWPTLPVVLLAVAPAVGTVLDIAAAMLHIAGQTPILGTATARYATAPVLRLVSLPRCLPPLLHRCSLELMPLVPGQVLPGLLLLPHPPPAWIVECGCEV